MSAVAVLTLSVPVPSIDIQLEYATVTSDGEPKVTTGDASISLSYTKTNSMKPQG
jgi:hypothetical protein